MTKSKCYKTGAERKAFQNWAGVVQLQSLQPVVVAWPLVGLVSPQPEEPTITVNGENAVTASESVVDLLLHLLTLNQMLHILLNPMQME